MKRFSSVLLLLFVALLSLLTLRAQSRAEILRAEYGAGNRWVDVTPRVRSMFRGNNATLRADNDTLGGDPVPGVAKVLRLVVRDGNGRIQQMEFREGQNVTLRGYNSANDVRGLRILGAQYGVGNRMMDVTNRLSTQIRGDRLSLQVMNQTMGGDPARGQGKALTVWYTFNGRSEQTVVNENGYLNLPGETAYNGDPRDRANRDNRYNGGALQITRAQYGVGNRMMDVTNRLNTQIQGDRLSLQVMNQTMGGDPASGQIKTLTVWYTFNGRSEQAVVNENGYLNLPGDTVYPGDARDNGNGRGYGNQDNRGYGSGPDGASRAPRTPPPTR
jgi:hypothetical protein